MCSQKFKKEKRLDSLMMLKNIFILILATLLLIPTVYSLSNKTIQPTVLNVPTPTIQNENSLNEVSELGLLLKYVGSEREMLKQKQKTYDAFLVQENNAQTRFMTIISVLGIILATILAISAFYGYQFIKDKFEENRRQLNAGLDNKIKKHRRLLKESFEDPLLKLEARINTLNDKFKFLLSSIERDDEKAKKYIAQMREEDAYKEIETEEDAFSDIDYSFEEPNKDEDTEKPKEDVQPKDINTSGKDKK